MHSLLGTYTFGTPAVSTVESDPSRWAGIISGSHQPLIEARLLTDFQDGPDPAGEDLPVLAGSVTFDATANVHGTLEMETLGVDELGQSRFPRRPSSPLAPYGNEVFIRRGVDLGDEVWWSPLGYYRIESAEQDGHAYAPIRIT